MSLQTFNYDNVYPKLQKIVNVPPTTKIPLIKEKHKILKNSRKKKKKKPGGGQIYLFFKIKNIFA
jgi:hypothetical protein